MRLILKRPLNDIWLDLEVPATSIAITQVLNGPGEISFTVPLEYLRKNGEDGKPLLQEYGTLVIAEDDADRIIQVALVDEVVLNEDSVSVSAGGFSMLATGTPWLGSNKSYIHGDPLKIFKDVWNHVFSYNNADLGVSFTGSTSSTGSLGTPNSAAYIQAKALYDRFKLNYEADVKLAKTHANDVTRINKEIFTAAGMDFIGTVVKRKTQPTENITKVIWCDTEETLGSPYEDGTFYAYDTKAKKWVKKNAAANKYMEWLWAKDTLADTKKAVTYARERMGDTKDLLSKVEDQKAAPYLSNWYSNQDLSQTLTELSEAGPFEYREEAAWSGDNLALSIRLGAPSVGTRRDDLVFELGVNVIAQPTVIQQDPYTEVLQLGAGEGSKQHRSSKTWSADGRVRRVQVLTDKDAKSAQATTNRATSALAKIQKKTGFGIDSLTVIDHSFARRTQYAVGDEIRITGPLSDGSDLDLWIRVTEITMTDTESTLNLKAETL